MTGFLYRSTPTGLLREGIVKKYAEKSQAKARMGSVLQNARFIHYGTARHQGRRKGLGSSPFPDRGSLTRDALLQVISVLQRRFSLSDSSCSCLTTIVLERWNITRNETSYPGRSRESFLVRHCPESHLSWKRRNKIMLIAVEDGVRNEPHGAILLPSPANQAAQQAK